MEIHEYYLLKYYPHLVICRSFVTITIHSPSNIFTNQVVVDNMTFL